MVLAVVVEESCVAVEDAGRTMDLQWTPSHIGISEYGIVESLAWCAHDHNDLSIGLGCFVEDCLLLYRTFRLRHSALQVAPGCLPQTTSSRNFPWAECSLHFRICFGSAFTGATLHQIKRATYSHGTSRGAVENLFHILFSCGEYHEIAWRFPLALQ